MRLENSNDGDLKFLAGGGEMGEGEEEGRQVPSLDVRRRRHLPRSEGRSRSVSVFTHGVDGMVERKC